MNYTLPSGMVINDVPDGTSEEELKRLAILNGLATEEDFAPKKDDDPSILENVGGIAADLGIGAMRATKSLVDLAAIPIPKALEKYTTDPAAEFFERGIEATEWIKPEAYKEAQARSPIERDEQGDFKGFQVPSWQSIAGITAGSLPQMPSFLLGGGIAGKGLKAFKWMKAHPKIAEALGYGIVNASLVAPSQWRETYNEAIESGMSDEDARKGADAAALLTAAISGGTGALGGAVGQKMGMTSGSMPAAIAKGFVAEAPFEGIEEAGQSAAGDIGMGRPVSGVNALEAGSLGVLGGGVPGAGIAAISHTGSSNTVIDDMPAVQRAEAEKRKRDEEGWERDRQNVSDIVEGAGGYQNLEVETPRFMQGANAPISSAKDILQKIKDSDDETLEDYASLLEAAEMAEAEGRWVALADLEEQIAEYDEYYVEKKVLPKDVLDKDEKGMTKAQNMRAGVYVPQNNRPVRRLPIDEIATEKWQLKTKPIRDSLQDVFKKSGLGLNNIKLQLLNSAEDVVIDNKGNYIYGVRKKRGTEDNHLPVYDKEGNYVRTNEGYKRIGFYDHKIKTIVLALEDAVESAQIDNAKDDGSFDIKDVKKHLLKTFDHEKVHAFRKLDLFTKKEWEILVNAAKKFNNKIPVKGSEDGSYYDWAKANYEKDQDGKVVNSKYYIEEEAVAQLIAGENHVSGKPRNLINRILNFFENMAKAVSKSNPDATFKDAIQAWKFEGVSQKIESGKLGKRNPDIVRSYQRSASNNDAEEAKQIIRAGSKKITNLESEIYDLLEGSRTPDIDDSTAIKEALEKHKELKLLYKQGAQEAGFDLNKVKAIDDANTDMLNELSAWHGSGAIFDRFSTDFIGTGEGMQVRGWGLYLGDKKETGLHYLEQEGTYSNDDIKKAKQYLIEKNITDNPDEDYGYDVETDYVKLAIHHGFRANKIGGLYRVDVPDHIVDAMLDLDKPISEQPRHIQELAKEIGFREHEGDFNETGETLRIELENQIESAQGYGTHVPVAEQASKYMLERGVPGNKFEDGWSRDKSNTVWIDGVDYGGKNFEFPNNFSVEDEIAADRILANLQNGVTTVEKAIEYLDDGSAKYLGIKATDNKKLINLLKKVHVEKPEITRNYVVFDDKDITILERNGKEIQPSEQRKDLGVSEQRGAPRQPLHSANPPSAATFESPEIYTAAKKARWQLQDRIIGLLNTEEAIDTARQARGDAKIKATESPYKGEERSHGIIENKAKLFHEGLVDGLAKRLAGLKISINELDRFLVLRHAMERNERIRRVNPNKPDAGAGYMDDMELTDANVQTEMNRLFEVTWDADRGDWVGTGNRDYQRLQEIAEHYVKPIVNGTLDEAVEGNLITPDEKETLKTGGFYKHYVPLKGFGKDMFSEVDAVTHYGGGAGAGGSMNIMGNQTRRATGRDSEAYSPIANLIADRERTIARAVKNKEIGVPLFNLIKSEPNEDVWKVYGPDDPFVQQYFDNRYTYVGNDPDIIEAIQADPSLGKKTRLEDKDNARDWVKQVASKTLTAGIIPNTELLGVKVNGKQNYIWIADKRLRQSLGNLNPVQANGVVKTLGNVNRFLSFVNTTINPEFVIGNFFRDLQTAVASVVNENEMAGGMLENSDINTAKLVKDVIKDLPKSMKGYYNNDRKKPLSATEQADIDEFLSSGAKAGWFHAKPAEESRANLQQMYDTANGKPTDPMRIMRNSKAFVETVNASVENAVRFSTWKAARGAFEAAGLTREEAVARATSMAKNMTINFNRKGESGTLINSLYLFFNAQVQGTAVVLRGVAGSNVKRGIMGSIAGLGALMAAFHDWLDDDEDKGLEHQPDYVRERNMILPGEIFGMDSDVKIPLPYGYNFFYQLGSNAYLMSQGRMSTQKMAIETVNSMMGAFNPMGAKDLFGSSLDETLARSLTPTAGIPLVETMTNKNYFGSPVYKEDIQFGTPKPDSHRTFRNTDATLKWLTQGLNKLSFGNESVPGFIDISPDTLDYLLGYALGGAGTFGQRLLTKPLGNMWEGKTPFPEWNDVPFVRRFIQEESTKPDVGLYYDRRDKINQKMAHIKATTGSERMEYAKDNRKYVAFEPVYKHIDKQLKVLRSRQKMIDEAIAKNPARGVDLAENQQKIQDVMDRLINKVNKMYEDKVEK